MAARRLCGSVHVSGLVTRIKLDFSDIPSDVALVLSTQQHVQELSDDLCRVMRLSYVGRELIRQEIVGSVAKVVDRYLAHRSTSTEK